MSKNILVIDDNHDHLLEHILKERGYNYFYFSGVKKAVERFEDIKPDIVLLDLIMPEETGFSFLKDLIKNENNIPVMVISGKNSPDVKLFCFDLGAIDFIVKPINYDELLARIKIHLQNFKARIKVETKCRLNLDYDDDNYEITVNKVKIHLTKVEYDIFKVLIDNANNIISRDDIIEEIWGRKIHVSPKNIDNHVARIRTKLKENSVNDFIKSIYGKGYVVFI